MEWAGSFEGELKYRGVGVKKLSKISGVYSVIADVNAGDEGFIETMRLEEDFLDLKTVGLVLSET